MDIDRGQRAGVFEHDTDLLLEMKDGTRKARHRLGRRSNDPVSVHSEVHVQNTPIIEMNELMLSSTLDGAHPGTGERAQRASRQSPPQSRVQHARALQRPPFDRRAEEPRGAFDFGKLRHELSR